MALGHRPLVGRVGLGRLPLRLLEGQDPPGGSRSREGTGSGGSRRRNSRSGARGRGPGLSGARERRRHGLGGRGDHGRRARPRRVRGRELGRAARRGIRLARVAPADLHRELRRGGLVRLGRQPVRREERRRVHGKPGGDEAREGDEERVDAVAPLPVQAHRDVGTPFENPRHEARQDRSGTDLEERARAGGVHRLDHLDEAHRVRHLAGEGRLQGRGPGVVRSGEGVRVDRDAGLAEGEVGEETRERLARPRDDAGVERRRDREPLERDPFRRELRLELRHVLRRPGDDDLRRAVVVRDDDARSEPLEERADLGHREAQRGHRARDRGRLFHQLPAAAHRPEEVGVGEDPGGPDGDPLAEAVPRGEVGRQADLAEERELRERDAGDGRLRPARRGEPLPVEALLLLAEDGAREDDLVKRSSVLERDVRRAVPDGERRRVGHREVGPHPDVLAPLAREEERQLPVAAAGAEGGSVGQGEAGRRGSVDSRRGVEEALLEARGVGGEDGEAGERPLPGAGRGVRLLSLLREERYRLSSAGARGEGAGLRRDVGRGAAGDDDELARKDPEALGARGGTPVLLERDVEVRAAEPEGADGGAPRVPAVADPGARLRVEVEGALPEPQLRVRRLDLDRRRQDAGVQGEDGLEESGCARSGLGVPDLALHGAERAPLAVRSAGRVEDEAKPLELGHVARLRPRPVRLEELDGVGAKAGQLVGTGERLRLPLGHRGVDAPGPAVRGGPDAADDGVDPVAVPLGVREPLEGHHPEPLAEHRPVGLVAERPAVAREGEGRGLREADVHEDVVQRVDAAGDDEVAAPELELCDRHREGAEGGSAGRVRDAVRPTQVQAVRDPPGDDVPEEPGERRLLPRHVAGRDPPADRVDLLLRDSRLPEGLHPHRPLEPAHHAGEELLRARHAEDDRDPGAVRRGELLAQGVLEHLLRDDEREELRRVGRRDRRGRNAPGERVEVDRVEEGAPPGVRLVRRGRVGVVVVLEEPVARRDVPDQVPAREDVPPEAAGVR